jgi:hypothetical protein
MSKGVSRRALLASAGGVLTTVAGSSDLLRGKQRVPAQPGKIACRESRDDIYYDQLDLIVQQDCDGGDTAQREGMYWLGNWVRTNDLLIEAYGGQRKIIFTQVMDFLEDTQKTGRFRRHPTQPKWKDPKDISRDQLIPLIAAMGVYKDFVRLDRFRDRVRQNIYFVNKDFLLFFEEFIKRARDQDLLFGGDIDRIILDKAVSDRCAQAKGHMDDVGDDLNLIVQLLLAAIRRGDQIKAVRARYVRDRPKNYGVYLTRYRDWYKNDFSATDKNDMIRRMEDGINNRGWKPDCTSAFGALKWYFRTEAGGSPGLAMMYKPILEKYFAGPIPG